MVSNGTPIKADKNIKNSVIDWDELRVRSIQHGGFGSERADIWPLLLNVHIEKGSVEEDIKADTKEQSSPHVDERQISLDTDRSFVLYPEEPKVDRETLQAGLHQLLVSVFRKRPALSYFQGYHDIATVFFLTLPQEFQLPCLEKVSLHRLRDSMGAGLEPVLGLLRVTKNLLHLADPEYAGILEQSSPLPFYALSNLLTLFSHDMPTLPLIQHVFDYLLCRPPIATVYLATSIILSRKREVLRLQEEDEDGMIHSLLSSLPNLVDDLSDGRQKVNEVPWKSEEGPADENGNFFKEEEEARAADIPPTSPVVESIKLEEEQINIPENANVVSVDEHLIPASVEDNLLPSRDSAVEIDKLSPTSAANTVCIDEEQKPSLNSTAILSDSDSPSAAECTKLEEPTTAPVPAPAHPQLTLVELLTAADALYEKFPPLHSGLALSSIMGPQSVIYTWSESHSALPSDRTAEAMVAHPELVVYPHVEADDQKEAASEGEKGEKEANSAKAHRRRRKLRKSPFGQMEKKTMLAGTVLVLGVAMAVYGIKARHAPGGHGLLYYADGHGHAAKDWRRVGGWLGGALAGVSRKVLNGLSSGP